MHPIDLNPPRLMAFFALIISLLMSSCGGDGTSSNDEEETPNASLEINANTTTATTGQELKLQAITKSSSTTSVNSFTWSFSDGQSATGKEISISFARAGLITATVNATLSDKTSISSTALISIFDGTTNAPPEFGLPAIYGDIDKDGALKLSDALALAQLIGGKRQLDTASLQAADLDLTGGATDADLNLMLDAVINQAALPSAILDRDIYPGGIVSIISPHLLRPDVSVAVRIDGKPTSTPMRTVLGYISTIAPTDLKALEETPVTLLVNAEVVDTFTINVKKSVSPTRDAREEILETINDVQNLLSAQQVTLSSYSTDSGL